MLACNGKNATTTNWVYTAPFGRKARALRGCGACPGVYTQFIIALFSLSYKKKHFTLFIVQSAFLCSFVISSEQSH